jgi:NAD(P)-dependent dehydrogenase (short-subunit alcohol dehydrogenase family)
MKRLHHRGTRSERDDKGRLAMKLDSSIAAVVTGGASGLGEATVRALAAHGVKVAIFDMNEARGEAVAADVGGVFCKCNVTSDEEVDAAFAKAREAHGQERILVNCAGIAVGQKAVARAKDTGEIRPHDMGLFEKVIAINLIGSFRCLTRGAAGMLTLERLDTGERGVIVNTASVADTILPGIMETPMMAAMPENVRVALAAAIPFPSRLGRPDEYASLVLELCRNAYINGECIRLDGAIRLAPR